MAASGYYGTLTGRGLRPSRSKRDLLSRRCERRGVEFVVRKRCICDA